MRAAEVAGGGDQARATHEMQQGMAAISHELAQAQARIQAMSRAGHGGLLFACFGAEPGRDHA